MKPESSGSGCRRCVDECVANINYPMSRAPTGWKLNKSKTIKNTEQRRNQCLTSAQISSNPRKQSKRRGVNVMWLLCGNRTDDIGDFSEVMEHKTLKNSEWQRRGKRRGVKQRRSKKKHISRETTSPQASLCGTCFYRTKWVHLTCLICLHVS